jgi:fatty acid desaturase
LFLISEKELDAEVPQGIAGTSGKFHVNFAVRMLISIQHFTFLPLCMLVGRFNLYAISIFFAIKDCLHPSTHIIKRQRALADLVGMSLFWAWHCALITQFDSTSERVLFVCASHFTVGILHVQLLLSHLATSTFTEDEEDAIGFFAFQLGTSRNIECMRYEHWFHGGLEYQIEHHLFPQLPRHNLHKVRPLVKEMCKAHGIEYREVGFFAAVTECLSDFKRLASDVLTLEMG